MPKLQKLNKIQMDPEVIQVTLIPVVSNKSEGVLRMIRVQRILSQISARADLKGRPSKHDVHSEQDYAA